MRRSDTGIIRIEHKIVQTDTKEKAITRNSSTGDDERNKTAHLQVGTKQDNTSIDNGQHGNVQQIIRVSSPVEVEMKW